MHLDALPGTPDPYPAYAVLGERRPHRLDGRWVVARPDEVETALRHPGLVVPAVGGRAGRPARLQARMARFSSGPAHGPRRAVVDALIGRLDVAALRDLARATTLRALEGAGAGPVDAMVAAREVPVTVLAAALGVPAEWSVAAVGATAELCAALSPVLGARGPADGETAVRVLEGIVDHGGRSVQAVGLLFQAHDATAGLIGNALVAGSDAGEAARRDPPVHWTRRVAAGPVELAGVGMAPGDDVAVLLTSAPFGAGDHACPGQRAALGLAGGVVAAFSDRGLRPLHPGPPAHEPRPNLRLPTRVPMAQP